MKKVFRIFLLYLLFISSLSAGHAAPYESPLQINSLSMATTASPSLYDLRQATGANGDSIILWRFGSTSSPTSYYRRIDAAGRSLQSQEISAPGTLDVGMTGTGNYALLSRQAEGSGHALYVSVYNRASGAAIVSSARINSGTQYIDSANIKMNESGQFLVTWSVRSGGTGTSRVDTVYARRFEANGAAATAQILVFTANQFFYNSAYAHGGIDASGNFVIAWANGDPYSGTGVDTWAQRFSAAGAALTGVFRVNTNTAGAQYPQALAMNSTGSFVVLWEGPVSGSSGVQVLGQRYSNTATALGGEFQVSVTSASSTYEGVGAGMAPDGSFVATWNDALTLWSRSYRADGTVVNSPDPVSSTGGSAWTTFARIGVARNGDQLLSWMQYQGGNPSSYRVLARRYWSATAPVQTIVNAQNVTPLSGAAGSWQYFKISIPAGVSATDFVITGGTGDADIYVRYGALPSLNDWNGRPYVTGNEETARFTGSLGGDWYIGVNGYIPYSGLTLRVTY